jgi:integrase
MLTNAAAKAAGARDRAYKLHDTGGLFLHVAATGTKTWRQKYRWRGREKLLVHGRFPELNLAQARMRMLEAKERLGRGVDPALTSATEIEGDELTFEQLARAWYRHNLATWSPAHAADVIGSLERDIFPALGSIAAGDIDPPQLLTALRSVVRRGRATTAQRLRQRLSEIFRYGKAEGLVAADPAEALGAAMHDAPPATPHPALATAAECRELLQRCESVPARPATLLASRFLALTAVRLDSVRGMLWPEVEDLLGDAPLWRVPPARLKLARAKKGEERFEHLVPLAPAAVAVLREAAAVNGYDAHSAGGLVFPGRSGSSPVAEGAIGELYQRAGYAGRHVPHGWRASFSTIMNEELGEDWSRTIDRALAHSPKDKVEAAYNRAQLLDRRREVMNHWSELLTGAN